MYVFRTRIWIRLMLFFWEFCELTYQLSQDQESCELTYRLSPDQEARSLKVEHLTGVGFSQGAPSLKF